MFIVVLPFPLSIFYINVWPAVITGILEMQIDV
jgi:hypothetical protein